jgi:uncharacterized protein YdaU (DUF1376 family)
MAEFPAMPLWTDAYLGDTTHLNALEHGAYLLLLMTAWRTGDCALPDDDRLLARYARCDARQWKKLRPILETFFTIRNGKWRQGRLTDEFQAASDRRRKAAANGRASALKRQGRHSAKREQSDSEATAKREPSDNLTISHNHKDNTLTSETETPRDEVPPNITDPRIAFEYVCRAAAWRAANDTQRQNGIGIIGGWLGAGCTLELILEGIARARKRDPSPTRSLKRFDSTIRGMRRDEAGDLPPTQTDVQALTGGVTNRMRAN